MNEGRKRIVYWLAQIGGWFLYILLAGIMNQLQGNFHAGLVKSLAAFFVVGILLSHLYRSIILKWSWQRVGILRLIPRVLIASFVFGVIFFVVQTFVTDSFISEARNSSEYTLSHIFDMVINWSLICLLWSLIYFSYQYFENYTLEEIKGLRYAASATESQLNMLKAQLNPHFMFNAMNSIRALVDENPAQAKEAITRLSSLLRNSLSLELTRVIPLETELGIVHDYLALEKIRYEERMKIVMEVEEAARKFQVPPMMVQTLMENAVKHGIAKLKDGGTIAFKAAVVAGKLNMEISNPGKLITQDTAGHGLKNTRERLGLLYNEQATFSIKEHEGRVFVQLEIPEILHV